MSLSLNNNSFLNELIIRTSNDINGLNNDVSTLNTEQQFNYNRTTNCYVSLLWNEYLQLWLSNVRPSTVLDSGNNPDLPPTRTSRFFYLFQMFYFQMYLTLIKKSSKNIFPSWFTYFIPTPSFSENMNDVVMYGCYYLMLKISEAVVGTGPNATYNAKEITDFFNSCKSGSISGIADTWIQSQVNSYWTQINTDFSQTPTNPTWNSAYSPPTGPSTNPSIPSGTWRPLEIPNGTYINSDWNIPWANLSDSSTYKTQGYATPNWGGVRGYEWYRGPGQSFPSQIQTSLNTYVPQLSGSALQTHMNQVKDLGANLTPREKFIAEFWEDGYGTAKPCGKWNFITRLIIRSLAMTEEQCLELLFLVNASLVNAFIVAWDVKRIYEAERPVTYLRRQQLNPVTSFTGWRGNNVKGGTINPDATHNFLPYQSPTFITPPFPGFISGHSTCSAAAATTISLYLKTNIVPNIMVPVPTQFNEHSSIEVLNEIRSNFPPYLEYDTANYTRVFLSFKTFDDMIQSAGWSRLYGGIHILPDHSCAVDIGKYLANMTVNAYNSK